MRELREIRIRRGMSQADLYERTGVSEFTISELEAGKRTNPRPSTLRKLAQGLGVEVTDLLGEPALPKVRPPLPEDWTASYPDEGFQRAVEGASVEELREAMKRHVGNRPPQGVEDFRRDKANAKITGAARARVFAHAQIVDEELHSRGDEAPQDYLPDYREYREVMDRG